MGSCPDTDIDPIFLTGKWHEMEQSPIKSD